jgi:hypothetical protein
LFGGDHETDGSDNDLHDTVDTGCEKTGAAPREAYTLEDLRGVVVDAKRAMLATFLVSQASHRIN